MKESLNYLLKHQRKSGGFATYNEEEIRNYRRIPETLSLEGWCGAVPDITCQVVKALQRLGEEKSFRKGIKYLMKNQSDDGGLRSYWWNNNTYSVSKSLRVVEDKNFRSKAKEWLLKQNVEIPFYLGLSLIGLKQTEQRSIIIRKLLEFQKKDGSW